MKKATPAGSDTTPAGSGTDIFWPVVSIKAVNRAKGGEPRLTYYCEYLGYPHREFYQMQTQVSGTEYQKHILKTLEFQQQQPFSLVQPSEDRLIKQQKEGCLYSSLDLLLGGGVFSMTHATAVAQNMTLLRHARGELKIGSSDNIDPYLMDKKTGFVSMHVLRWILQKHTPFRILKNPMNLFKQGCGRYMVCAWSAENQKYKKKMNKMRHQNNAKENTTSETKQTSRKRKRKNKENQNKHRKKTKNYV